MIGNALPAALAQTSAARPVSKQSNDSVGHGRGVTRCHQVSRDAFQDGFRRPPDGRGNDWDARCHRLEDDVAHRFRFGGVDEGVGRRIRCRELFALEIADEAGIEVLKLPFEIASVLLLVAVVGSVVMAKKRI